MSSEFLIIGGGVIGLSIARTLHKQGAQRITIVEKGECAGEASWAAAGMLGVQAESNGAGPFFDLCGESRDMFPQLAAELLDETGIDIELDRTGTLCVAFSEEEARELDRRYGAQRGLGLNVKHLSRDEVLKAEPQASDQVLAGLLFPNDWQVDNRKLCSALLQYARANGIDVRENTAAEGLIVESGCVAGVRTEGGPLTASQTVLAAGAWSSLIEHNGASMPFTVEPVRGQIIELHPVDHLFRHVIQTHRGYIVPRADGRILAGSTTEHVGFAKEVTETATAAMRSMVAEISPVLDGLEITDSWSGLRPFAGDDMPVLGPIEGTEGLFVATGHYRNGILLAPVTADIAAGYLMTGECSEHCRTFGPGRFTIKDSSGAIAAC